MKTYKYIITCALIALFTIQINAQENERRERIKVLKIAYITEKLELSTEEAEKFWPIYNKFDDTLFQLRNVELRKIKGELRGQKLALMTDGEATEILNRIESIESKLFSERKEMTKQLRRILPSKKIILLKKVEDDFNRELLRKLRDRRRNGGRNK